MNSSKKYYKKIGLIRVLACISVLLYHMNILKGGYLAVCTFFVLSGYLSCVSCFRKDKFSLKEYYLNKFLHIYLPFAVVVFISIFVISLFPNINWFNLKPEATSVLLGYNNFWQLSANMDYFARHINSPFMHFWYMAIILQFDCIFPFIYLALRKVGDKINKNMSYLIATLFAHISLIFFCKLSLDKNIMVTYYNTFARVFSLLFGVAIGFIHSYHGIVVPHLLRNKYVSRIMLYVYIMIILVLFVFIDAKSMYYSIAMIFVTLISCRLLDYGILTSNDNLAIFDKFIKFISSISYEIYLVQYPVIFLFQYINVDGYLKLLVIVTLIFILSCILHFSLNFKKMNKRFKVLRYISFIAVMIISLYGGYLYFISKDHTAEMKELELKLAENEKMMLKRQEEYALSLKEEQDKWTNIFNDLENAESKLASVVTNLHVVGVGDSVMLGALDSLYKQFPNGYFDAKTSRTAWVANGILENLQVSGLLGDPIVMNLGANGDCPDSLKHEIMNTIGNRQLFWLNVTNDTAYNRNLSRFASYYDNLHVVDWYSISYGHPEYFVSDGIHLTEVGIEAFTKTIYNSIYEFYLKEYEKEKEEMIKLHEEELNNKMSFIGNGILLNAFDYLQKDFSNAEFIINAEYDYETIKHEIQERIKDETLTKKIVFALDNSVNLSNDDYKNLIELCDNHDVYILVTSHDLTDINYEDATVINFYDEIIKHDNYLMADKIHLTDDGNKALNNIIKGVIK